MTPQYLNIYQPPPIKSPPVLVALNIAQHAHRLEIRRKPIDGVQVAYVGHPILAYKILKAYGETDTATLMAALLHDAVETVADKAQAGPYAGKPEVLRAALLHELPNNEALIDEVMALVHELTPKPVRTNKITSQQMEAMQYSSKAALIKMADHAASLLDDLCVPPDDSHEKRGDFFERTRTVANLASQNIQTKLAFSDPLALRAGDLRHLIFDLTDGSRHILDVADTARREERRLAMILGIIRKQPSLVSAVPLTTALTEAHIAGHTMPLSQLGRK
ncbi:MAG: hypothetical protein K2Q12_03085 [Rickettsiales bacterium]|nr:hypothetical protein [Rickettsiales bacterium]